MVDFTPSQKDAIKTEGRSLMVSAGAGSGKTTVLTQRIIRSIKNGVDIDEILVATFTKASAADMKEKIYNALSKASAEDIQNKRLSEMTLRVASARISTISSFCLSLIRENFQLFGLSPKIRVADDMESKPLLDEALARVEERFFEEENSAMTLLADTLGGEKSFESLDKAVLKLYGKFRSWPFWKSKLKDTLKKRKESYNTYKDSGFYKSTEAKEVIALILEKLKALESRSLRLCDFAETVAANESNVSCISSVYQYISAICELNSPTFEELKVYITGFKPENVVTKGLCIDDAIYIKQERQSIISDFRSLERFFEYTEEQIVSDMLDTVNLNEAVITLLFAVDEEYTLLKNKRGICDYADVEHLALKLLAVKTDSGILRTELCKRICNSTKEIYVDEYQDVSPLQDTVFELLSNGSNCFFVGDVKQSVYRFRNADVRLFADRVKNAQSLDVGDGPAKIFLRENFRCTQNIVDFVNTVFEKHYTPENTGYSYSEEKLICGLGHTCTSTVDVEYITGAKGDARNVCEATTAAARIVSMIGRTRKSDGSMLKYGDIAVLLRSASGRIFDYEKIFRQHNIPFVTKNSTSLTEQPEVMLLVSLLTVVDDPTDEIALAASLRSPVFGFTAEELRLVRMFRPYEPFSFAVSACSKEYVRKTKHMRYTANRKIVMNGVKGNRYQTVFGKRPPITVLEKCNSFINVINELSDMALELPSHKLIWSLFEKTKLLEIVSCTSHGEEKKNNLLNVYSMAVSYESGTYRGLSAFLDYLKLTSSAPDDTAAPADDCVKIMTFHKSKGLEFPVCIICGTGNLYNIDDISASYLVGDDAFVYFNLRGADGLCSYEPLIKRLAAEREKHEMLCEELRALYVALTRAKERLYVLGCINRDVEKIANSSFGDGKSNMERIISALYSKRDKAFTLSELPYDCVPSPESVRPFSFDIPEEKKVSWVDYNYKSSCTVPAKVAVSELRPGLLETDEYERSVTHSAILKTPVFADDYRVTSAEKGTATHLFMQFCSFENVLENGVENEAKRLCEVGMLTQSQADIIRYDELKVFFDSPLFKQMCDSPSLKREMRFTLAESDRLVGEEGNESVLVQGVIDCFFQNGDGSYTVVDYKTDRIKKGDEQVLIDRHKVQLGYYARAVEKMTGCKVTASFLYSFSLGKPVRI